MLRLRAYTVITLTTLETQAPKRLADDALRDDVDGNNGNAYAEKT